MNRSLVPFLLGACALSTAYAAARLIAPFYGLGVLLVSSTLAIAFLALGGGLAAAALPERRPGVATALLVAAGWTILLPWIRTPALRGLEGIGLGGATVLAVVIFAGVPLACLGLALGRCLEPAPSDPAPDLGPSLPIAFVMCGVAISTLLTLWVFVPLLGVARTLLATAALEALAAGLGFAAGGRGRAGASIALLAFASLSGLRFPAVVRDGAHGLIESREGRAIQYRVIEREDGRFLIGDGAIETLLSTDTGDGLMRHAAALRVLDLYFARPESVLVLGLRGGSVAKWFARDRWRVRQVEPDPLAVRMAFERLSFSPREVPTEIADLRTYCRRASGRYPVVILDALGTSAVPFHLVTREALAEIGGRVANHGILALTIVTHGWKDPVLRSLAAMLHAGFRNVVALPTSEPPDAIGSIVLLASNRSLDLPDEKIPQPTDFLMNLEEHWAVVQLTHAWFNRFEPKTRGAVILTDDRNPIELWNDPVERAARAELHASFAHPPRSW